MDENKLIATAEALERLSNYDEQTADAVMANMDFKEEDVPKIKNTFEDFVSGYAHKSDDTSDKDFLVAKFKQYPTIWSSDEEIEDAAVEIVETVYAFQKNKAELDAHIADGKRRESWLAHKIEDGAKFSGANSVSEYALTIDTAIENANNQMADTILRLDGQVSQNPNLDGYIAETHHANTYNIDAAQKEVPYHAEVPQSNNPNSVDLTIKNSDGKIVSKYQSKYGSDSEATGEYFKDGNYRGQQRLVPEGQGKDITNSHEKIEYGGAESTPLSKERAKELQQQAQAKGEIAKYSWNDLNKFEIAKQIGAKSAFAAGMAVAFQGARIIGRRIWNFFTGNPNNSLQEDLAEFAEYAIKSGATVGVTVAGSGAMTVVVRSGWLGQSIIKTSAKSITASVFVGIEAVKSIYLLAKGKISGAEAMDNIERATASCVFGMMGFTQGAAIGAAIGAVLGPVGSAIGGAVGGLIGGAVSGKIGEAIHDGRKMLGNLVVEGMKTIAKGIGKVFSGIGNAIANFFSFSWW